MATKKISGNVDTSYFDAITCDLEEGTYLLVRNVLDLNKMVKQEMGLPILFDEDSRKKHQEELAGSISESFDKYETTDEISEKILSLHNILLALELQFPAPQKNILIESALKRDYDQQISQLSQLDESEKAEKLQLLKVTKNLLEMYAQINEKFPDEFLSIKLSEDILPYFSLPRGDYILTDLKNQTTDDPIQALTSLLGITGPSKPRAIYDLQTGRGVRAVQDHPAIGNKTYVIHSDANGIQKNYQISEDDFKTLARTRIGEYAIIEITRD